MSEIFLYTGIVLVSVPLVLMIGFATFIFWSFMRDDETTAGVLKVGFVIMALGAVLIGVHVASVLLEK